MERRVVMPISNSCKIGEGTKIWHPGLVNLYDCEIGKDCSIGAFVEIGRGVKIGDRCRIAAHCYIPENVELFEHVFLGPGVVFVNDKHPPSGDEWRDSPATKVMNDVAIGARAVILPSLVLGEDCMIGAGSVVTKDVLPHTVVAGNPARVLRGGKLWKGIK